jgi:AsmA family
MQSAHTHNGTDTAAGTGAAPSQRELNRQRHRLRNRLIVAFLVLLVVFLLGFIPPLINVSRFQRRIERNISNALGRNVTFDRVSLSLLPLPSFTLDNFVIDDDPAYSFEPVLRADQVHVSVRFTSLFTRHVEFSKISLTEPTSVNLVRRADGHWNIEGLLLQASHIDAAPTEQRHAGAEPRFPYIEATGARLNLKLDQEKVPFSLIDADFALWLPEPHQWHLRLEAHPTRTDLSPGDTGTLRAEGVLGGTGTPAASTPATLAQVPIDLEGDWRDAQLGDLSRLLSGTDAGLRGDLSLTFSLHGTVQHNTIATGIELTKARRADFDPPQPLALEASCTAVAENTFHAFSAIECHWPPPGSGASSLIVAASLPDATQPHSSSGQITVPALPAATLFEWLSVATPHPPAGLAGPGTLAGSVAWAPATDQQTNWTGELEFSGGTLPLDPDGPPIELGDIVLRSSPAAAAPEGKYHRSSQDAAPAAVPAPDSFDLLPVSLDLGGKQPATLEGHLDATGYSLHLTGSAIPARLLALGDAVPQLGDGLKECLETMGLIPAADAAEPPATPRGNARGTETSAPDTAPAPISLDLIATRAWGGAQAWRQTAAPDARPHKRPHH